MDLDTFARKAQEVGEYLHSNVNPNYEWIWAGGQGGTLRVPGGGSLGIYKKHGNTQAVLVTPQYPEGYEQPRYRRLGEPVEPKAITVYFSWKIPTIVNKIRDFVAQYQPLFAQATEEKYKDDCLEKERVAQGVKLLEAFPGYVRQRFYDTSFEAFDVADPRVRALYVQAPNSVRIELNNIPMYAVYALLEALQASKDDDETRLHFVYSLLHEQLDLVLAMAKEAHQFYQNDPMDGYDEEMDPGGFDEAETAIKVVNSFVEYLKLKAEANADKD